MKLKILNAVLIFCQEEFEIRQKTFRNVIATGKNLEAKLGFASREVNTDL